MEECELLPLREPDEPLLYVEPLLRLVDEPLLYEFLLRVWVVPVLLVLF